MIASPLYQCCVYLARIHEKLRPEYADLPDYILKCTAQIWEGRDIAALDWHYADDLLVRTPTGISRGNAAGKANTMATLTEFPDRQLLGEDVIWCGDEDAGFLSSHRMGVSHVEVGPRGVRREITLFDEIAIWKQILLQG